MSIPALLTLLALSALRGHGAALPPTPNFLKESIKLLGQLLATEVSCDKMNVTDIFAGDKPDDMEILCKATTVTLEGGSCHSHLEAISLNLFNLVQTKSTVHKVPCPVAAGNTSLPDFLHDLHRVLQRLAKDENLE